MSINNPDWDNYYRVIKGRAARPLIIDALKRFDEENLTTNKLAIDLGCGDGTETAYMLEKGWHVLAIDGEPAAIKYLLEKVNQKHENQLQTQVAKFQDATLTPSDLVHASLSLPFCPPELFAHVWSTIVKAIKVNGRFAGQFFGPHDTWAADNPQMTFHTEEQVCEMFAEFEIEFIKETDEDGQATSGPKHWHVFDVIARKR